GLASASEELYNELTKLREKKPVVVTIQGVAASGAYYMLLGANHVVSGGAMIVGSIGALISPPGPEIPSEFVQSTGPAKLTGGSERTYLELLEEVKEAFYATVKGERGDRLRAPREEIITGQIWLGLDAFQLGLIDEIGDETDAIRKAADLAGLHRFNLISLEEKMTEEGGRLAQAVATAEEHRPQGDFDFDTSQSRFPYIHYLYLPPR
ncbi:MAG: S49 family peptidase, partial [Dehalococcoidia bacterium]